VIEWQAGEPPSEIILSILLLVFPEDEMKRCDPKTVEAARARHAYHYAAAAGASSS
jgi:hypothetical protein